MLGKTPEGSDRTRPIESPNVEDKLWTKNFVLIIFINLIIFFGFQMLLPTLPLYVEKLGGSQSEAGFVIGIFAISAVAIRPFAGRAIDIYGRKGIFLSGLVIFLVSVLAYNWMPTVLLLMVFRLIHGFGWGGSSTAAGTIATDIIPKKRLAEGMGYYGLAGDISMAVGPAFGLFLTSSSGFPALFFTSGLAIMLAILLGLFITYRPVPSKDHTVKMASFFEKQAFRPSLVMLFVTMTFGVIVSFLALFANTLGIKNVGIFFTVYAIALMMSRPLLGRLADKKGFDLVVIPGILAIFVSMLILSQARTLVHPLMLLLIAAAVYGFGFGAVQPSLQAMTVQNVPFSRRGAANATFFSSFDLGIGLGSALGGIIADMAGYNVMYMMASIPALLALFFYLLTGRHKKVQM